MKKKNKYIHISILFTVIISPINTAFHLKLQSKLLIKVPEFLLHQKSVPLYIYPSPFNYVV